MKSTYIDWDKQIDEFEGTYVGLFGNLGRRTKYLWEWVYKAANNTQLTPKQFNTDESLLELANSIKTLGVMWDVLVDDIADELELSQSNRMLPFCISDLPVTDVLTPPELKYILLCREIEAKIYTMSSQLPGYNVHREHFFKEYIHLKEAMSYSLKVRQDTGSINLREYINKLSNNMHMVINGLVDLMVFNVEATFDSTPEIKKLLWSGQRMGRIGNSVTTYEKEVLVSDYSSEVIAFALEYGIVDIKLLPQTERLLERLRSSNVENILWSIWDSYYKVNKVYTQELPDLDVDGYIKGLVLLREYHEESRGKK